MNGNPFGYFPPQAKPVTDISIEHPDNFETRVFTTKRSTKQPKVSQPTKPACMYGESKKLPKCFRKDTKVATLQDLKREWSEHLRPPEEKLDDQITTLVKVDKKDKVAFVLALDKSITSVYQFLLKEVAPLRLALDPATEQVKQAIELITNTETELKLDAVVIRMLDDAVNLKIFDFVTEKMLLDPALKKLVLDKYFNQLSNLNRGKANG